MSASIISCPACQSLILSDTDSCPTCGHVREGTTAGGDHETANVHYQNEEVPCRACGEMVRQGLVRCWKCGGFMRDDIAEKYQQMMSTDRPVIYSQIDDDDQYVADDDDFEMDDDTGFELASGQEMTTQSAGQDYTQSQKPARPAPAQEKPAASAAEQPAEAAEESVEAEPAEQPAETAGEKEKEQADKTPAASTSGSHAENTGGDVLFNIALAEEKESKKRRKVRRMTPRSKDGFIVFCPNGHRIEVRERHRGKSGRCPKCKTAFFVPLQAAPEPTPPEGAETVTQTPEEAALADSPSGKFTHWMQNVGVHTLDPAKLKLKVGSMATPGETVDVGFSKEGILLVGLAKPGGLFGGNIDKKRDEVREELFLYLKADKPVGEEMPGLTHQLITPEQLAPEVKIVQPAPYAHESMFAGIDVFGEGKIAVRIPSLEGSTNQRFLTFVLSGYRELAAQLESNFGVANFGVEVGLPLEDSFSNLKCHYSEKELPVLEDVTFHEADPDIKVELAGFRCEGCQLVVSEEARKKEKIGGKNPKTVAKAKCPKCGQKFGNNPLYTLEGQIAETAITE